MTGAWTNTKMTVFIDGAQKHEDTNGNSHFHRMQVDNVSLLVDLSKVSGQLLDPTIDHVAWGVRTVNGDLRAGGVIVQKDGHSRVFWDSELLKPYLDVWRLERARLLQVAP